MTIPQDQSSEDWKIWRNSHIGASDIACILGISKWATPLQLWKRKVGFLEGIKDNYAMQRGRDLEPFVRDMFNNERAAEFEPEVLVHPDLEWASASLDGIDRNYGGGAILEIKCPGLADHQIAEMGEVPDHYKPQLHWQMFCSQMNHCLYASYYKEELVVVQVPFDAAYIAEILPVVSDFYQCMINLEEPAHSEDDFIQITEPEFEHAAREWKAAAEMAKQFAEKEKYYKEKLISFTDDSNCSGFGVSLRRVERDGSIDWKRRWSDLLKEHTQAEEAYPEASYRNDSIGYWKVTEDNK